MGKKGINPFLLLLYKSSKIVNKKLNLIFEYCKSKTIIFVISNRVFERFDKFINCDDLVNFDYFVIV